MKSLAEILGTDTPASSSPTSDTAPKKLTVKSLAKGILESVEYRRSVARRVADGTLPPAVECKLYEYAYGKPVDKVEINDKRNNLEDLSTEQLEARAMELAALARKLRGEESGATDDVAPGSVH